MRKLCFLLAICLIVTACEKGTKQQFENDITETSKSQFQSECGKLEISDGEYITMKVLPEIVTINSSPQLIFENHTEKDITYGQDFSLEYFDEDHWIPLSLNIGFQDILYFLPVGETNKKTMNLYRLIEWYNCKKGKYRMIKKVNLYFDFFSSSSGKTFYRSVNLCTEFELK